MRIFLDFVTELPDPADFEALMRDYYTVMSGKVLSVGGPALSPAALAASTMAHLDEMLPPDGRLLLATEDNGALIGCGAIRKIRPDAAEFKRMYVRPEAQGSGLGRLLFEQRINEARVMGCNVVYADTVKDNRAMLTMYERFGFRYIPRYPENANPETLAPYLVFLEHQLA